MQVMFKGRRWFWDFECEHQKHIERQLGTYRHAQISSFFYEYWRDRKLEMKKQSKTSRQYSETLNVGFNRLLLISRLSILLILCRVLRW